LTGGLKGLVVRYDATYYATNCLTLTAAEVRRLYAFRAQIAAVMRVCKDQLGLTGLSSPLRAGPNASLRLLLGRLLCPRAGTP
jgi:hypothetical protein